MNWNKFYTHAKSKLPFRSAINSACVLAILQFVLLSCSITQEPGNMTKMDYGSIPARVRVCTPAEPGTCLDLSNKRNEVFSVNEANGRIIELTFSKHFPVAVAPFQTHIRLVYSPALADSGEFTKRVLNDETPTMVIDKVEGESLQGALRSVIENGDRIVLVDYGRYIKVTSCFRSRHPLANRCALTWRHNKLGLLSASVMIDDLDKFADEIGRINHQLTLYASSSAEKS